MKGWRSREEMPGRTVLAFAAGLCVATAALVWLGYVATREWRRGTDLLLERRSAEALALVSAALNRDMKGAWTTVLVPMSQVTVLEEPPYDAEQIVARAFARFPYPESFIIWKNDGRRGGATYALNRAERRPSWDAQREEESDPFPVVVAKDPLPLQPLVAALRDLALAGQPFVMLETTVAGLPYHVVAHVLYATNAREPTGLVAFTVNLQWIRQQYFAPLLREVAKIGGDEQTLSLAVTDVDGNLLATTGPPPADRQDFQRRFPLLFIDRTLVSAQTSGRPTVHYWTVHVRPSRDNTLIAVVQGTRRTFALMAIAAAASLLALVVTAHAARTNARLATMKSDFVSAVTHELKTPLALIRLVGETLERGRYSSAETVQEYAQLLSKEVTRLSRSIDNLLTYARYTDQANGPAVTLMATDLRDLVDEALEPFRPTLTELQFQLAVDIPADLPRVSADRAAIVQAMENVIDNAIKYSDHTRMLQIMARAIGRRVTLTFADRGIGILDDDLQFVSSRFFRGRNATSAGSGLGLAIAQRILQCHGGEISVDSTVGQGTHVNFVLVTASES